jgi:hypothetical protein
MSLITCAPCPRGAGGPAEAGGPVGRAGDGTRPRTAFVAALRAAMRSLMFGGLRLMLLFSVLDMFGKILHFRSTGPDLFQGCLYMVS